MCGIVGYVGKKQAAPILLESLSKLEYRGYDSAGLAVESPEGALEVVKAKGRLHVLEEMTDRGHSVSGLCGIGQTRWATHGEPSVNNAHPHCNSSKTIAVVHNGIIENYRTLKEKMTERGYRFTSETDTEVIPHLLDYYYKGDPLETITKVMVRMEGSYALGILFQDFPGRIFAVRKDSPMIVGRSGEGNFIASDVPAILRYTREVYFIENMEIAELGEDTVCFYNLDKEEVPKEASVIQWDAGAAEKGGYEFFMLKEIYEQPKAIQDTVSARVKNGILDLSEIHISAEEKRQLRRIYIIACGSAYHAGVAAKYVFEELAGIPVEVEVASEFRYRHPVIEEHSLAILISQSGETADTLAALKEMKRRGVRVLSIVNVVGSSIARESDSVLYTWAGPEIAVATTKGYTTQLAALYMLSVDFAMARGCLTEAVYRELLEELLAMPDKIQSLLGDKERIQWFASKYAASHDIFFIGRGVDYGTSLEGSLKLKEISYIHSEAYAAGELKHGTISLVEDGTLVVGVATQPELYEKTVSNLVEVKSRGAYIMTLTEFGNFAMEEVANFNVYIPRTVKYFSTLPAIIPLQLLAYYVSLAKGLDVDKPRNLAKSVTVE